MYHWSKIPEEHRPEIVSDISDDDKLYTFIVQDWNFNKIKRKDALTAGAANAARAVASSRAAAAVASSAAAAVGRRERRARLGPADRAAIYAVGLAWEGYYWNKSQVFKNIIDKNIPCTLMHKVKNEWAPEIDTIVCFMTGDALDVFLVHPKDLTEWDPNDV